MPMWLVEFFLVIFTDVERNNIKHTCKDWAQSYLNLLVRLADHKRMIIIAIQDYKAFYSFKAYTLIQSYQKAQGL